jgi:hypothetical protein
MIKPHRLYVIDANIFMQAARSYYSFNIAPVFWDTLVKYAQDNKIISIDKVFQEIKEGSEDDLLRQWAKVEFCNYFDTTKTPQILRWYKELVRWANAQSQYFRKAKDEFMDVLNADAWVLAYAKANDCILVTTESPKRDAKRIIPIPNVCEAFSIEYCDTFEMLTELEFSFPI